MSEDMLGKNALAQVAGPFQDFAQKLGGPDGPSWLEAFKRFLRKEEPWTKFPTWRTITLGTHKSASALLTALGSTGYRVSDWARDLMNQSAFTLAKKKVEVNLVRVTVKELGFPKGATRKEIYDRAAELGLKLCPAEVGPALRLAYTDQPMGEWLLIAMNPITDSGGFPRLFRVDHDRDGLWLHTRWSDPVYVWNPGDEFVFAGIRG